MPEGVWLGLPTSFSQVALVIVRLLAALLLGALVAVIYRQTRAKADVSESFTVTLVLLAILIAMVTQVIGDNVARAFSLVGALSIVRFRTVVRDTQDTAYVIFAVAVGMALGANNATVALSGIAIVAVAAFALRARNRFVAPAPVEELPFELTVRLALGLDAKALLSSTLDRFQVTRRLMSVSTARQGLAVDVGYRAALHDEGAVGDLVNALNKLEGVQGVTLQRIVTVD
ncbi:MAG TPA: DUF4956 domain-containing protein [Vicinamibacterales bacterium]|nr:DUF4956 domain-containing protein [Vicinamibacterales bacterium]